MERTILQCVVEEEILFTNKKIFKDNDEHAYKCKCYDGVAVCTPCDDEHELPMIVATYPKKKDVLSDKELCRSIRYYRGLYDLRNTQITYGDIMLKLGELSKITDEKTKMALQLMAV